MNILLYHIILKLFNKEYTKKCIIFANEDNFSYQ